MTDDPIHSYLKKLGDTMDQYQDEMQQSMIPRYNINMALTPEQIKKVMELLHPHPYESKDHKG